MGGLSEHSHRTQKPLVLTYPELDKLKIIQTHFSEQRTLRKHFSNKLGSQHKTRYGLQMQARKSRHKASV